MMQKVDGSLDKIEYEQTTMEELIERESKSFDLVCCSEVIEHVND